MSEVAGVKRVAVVGAGAIGASWSALFLARGLDVVANDVSKGSEHTLRLLVEQTWPALTALGVATDASMARLRFDPRLEEACVGADFVQECATERELKKIALIATIDASVPPNVIIASSDVRRRGLADRLHRQSQSFTNPALQIARSRLADDSLERAVFELNRRGFPNRQCSDSTCWLGGGQQECQSRIHKICETA